MNLLENVHGIWHIIGRNKMRSFLTMLGIIIGIMSVIVIMSVGAGAQSLILNQINGMGSNLVGVLPGKSDEKGPPASVYGIVITTLKYDDAKALVGPGNPHIAAVAAYVRGLDTVYWEDNQVDTTFVGTNASLIDVEDTKVEQGRFFTDEEDRGLARVAVIGTSVKKDLFGDDDPIGKKIKIKKTNFTIIGVMRARGSSGFQNQDDQIYVPITTAQKLLLGIDYINYLRIKIDSAENINESIEYIKSVLRERHKITNPDNDDFSVRSMEQGIEAITSVTNALRFFLAAVASIALVVGGIGIMNIMLAAVQERTREIGLRKAVGAHSRHITTQFLIETVMITLMGGVIGIILGSIISFIVGRVAISMKYDWDIVISFSSILLSCFVSIGIGLIFGILPARRASRLNPIEALRYE
jgi:putative ABC transport system permease protein